MSPRIALTTACSDSPSKLNVASPVLPARFGGGDAAASRSITTPLPRRICARGMSASGVVPSAVAAPGVPGAGTCVPASRRTVGDGEEAQAARQAARQAASAALARESSIEVWVIAGILGAVFGRRRRLLLRLAAQLRAARLDALADGFHLVLRRPYAGLLVPGLLWGRGDRHGNRVGRAGRGHRDAGVARSGSLPGLRLRLRLRLRLLRTRRGGLARAGTRLRRRGHRRWRLATGAVEH